MRSHGFTLLEIMIVLTIIAILVTLAYPSYQQYVLRSYRAEGITTLLELASRQEQWLLDQGRYANNLTELGYPDGFTASGRYQLSLSSQASPHQFQLIAEAAGPQRQDYACLTLSINHLGQRNHNQGAADLCWP